VCQAEAFGLTSPLLAKADGGKFGKTESGAVWLTAERTSAYAFYQFWMNAADADVGHFLKWFTMLPREEIERIEQEHTAEPGKRSAQRTLAEDVTKRVHGEEATEQAEQATQALFSGKIDSLPLNLLNEVFSNVPSSAHKKSTMGASGMAVLELLLESGVAKSKREGRQYLDSGAISVNGKRVDQSYRLTDTELLHGAMACIRRGRKTWHVTRWS
jgi:tyrosyl-tRNA synthetase